MSLVALRLRFWISKFVSTKDLGLNAEMEFGFRLVNLIPASTIKVKKNYICSQVSDQDFSITLDAYFNVKWQDPRLVSSLFNNNVTTGSDKTVRDKFTMTAVNVNILPKLWIPDLEIMDLMSFETHKILSRLEGEYLIWTVIRQT